MSGSAIIGKVEVAAIKQLADLEVTRGTTLSDDERKAFKLGFVGGFSDGMEHASDLFKGETLEPVGGA